MSDVTFKPLEGQAYRYETETPLPAFAFANPSERGCVMGWALSPAEIRAQDDAAKTRAITAHADLLAIAKMAADGTYIPRDHAREVLQRHGLVPKEG